MRRYLVGLALLAIVAAACAPESSTTSAAGPTDSGAPAMTPAECATAHSGDLYAADTLTIATGNPAYSPWYGGKSVPDSEWESSSFTGDPHTGDGYEAAFAYALAERLGFTEDQVSWIGIPFNKSFAPGPKDFDFAMQQISISPKRAEAVDFSEGYFDVNQALIANEGSPAIGATTFDELKDLKLGAPIGTTSLQVIEEQVQPNVEPTVYDDLDLALKDLDNGQVDAVVVDFPTAFYGYADVVVGQFPNLGGEQEQFGLSFEKGNAFKPCIDQAIVEMREDGTLDALKDEWLETDTSVPTFS
ncbi:MAG TPA: ABC transporter substrate-binding protein [Actinomycetota bacterium]|nr:ABC transporter substrate-binding protein [Actinomycetota bacterium]